MRKFNVVFYRYLDGKRELRRVTNVPAKNEQTAANKAHRKIGFATKYDHWKVFEVKEVLDALSLQGFKVVPMREDEDRLPRSRDKILSEKDMDKPYEHTIVSERVLRNRDTR